MLHSSLLISLHRFGLSIGSGSSSNYKSRQRKKLAILKREKDVMLANTNMSEEQKVTYQRKVCRA